MLVINQNALNPFVQCPRALRGGHAPGACICTYLVVYIRSIWKPSYQLDVLVTLDLDISTVICRVCMLPLSGLLRHFSLALDTMR